MLTNDHSFLVHLCCCFVVGFVPSAKVCPRSLDVTICELEPAIHARNVLLLYLIATGSAKPNIFWNLFFHIFIDHESQKALKEAARKLLSLGPDVRLWNGLGIEAPLDFAVNPGFFVRMINQDTYVEVRRIWEGYASETRDEEQIADEVRKRMKGFLGDPSKAGDLNAKDGAGAKMFAFAVNHLLSSGPFASEYEPVAMEIFTKWWTTGTISDESVGNATLANPLLLYTKGCGQLFNLDPLTYPISAFHVFSAFLTEGSAVSIHATNPSKSTRTAAALEIVQIAQGQFHDWCEAFRKLVAEENSIVSDQHSVFGTIGQESNTEEVDLSPTRQSSPERYEGKMKKRIAREFLSRSKTMKGSEGDHESKGLVSDAHVAVNSSTSISARIRSRIVLRLAVADPFDLCEAFCVVNGDKDITINHYPKGGLRSLRLECEDYQENGNLVERGHSKAPTRFDVIDTGDLGMTFGIKISLVAVNPLLLRSPQAVIYTQHKVSHDIKSITDALSHEIGDVTTFCLLARLVPLEVTTGVSADSLLIETKALHRANAADINGVTTAGSRLLKLAWKDTVLGDPVVVDLAARSDSYQDMAVFRSGDDFREVVREFTKKHANPIGIVSTATSISTSSVLFALEKLAYNIQNWELPKVFQPLQAGETGIFDFVVRAEQQPQADFLHDLKLARLSICLSVTQLVTDFRFDISEHLEALVPVYLQFRIVTNPDQGQLENGNAGSDNDGNAHDGRDNVQGEDDKKSANQGASDSSLFVNQNFEAVHVAFGTMASAHVENGYADLQYSKSSYVNFFHMEFPGLFEENEDTLGPFTFQRWFGVDRDTVLSYCKLEDQRNRSI
ncbi:hypothetical protein HDU76_001122, partial [Blyttiomyces sp. JEL0837]